MRNRIGAKSKSDGNPQKETKSKYRSAARAQIVEYTVVSQDSNGKVTPVTDPHKLELNETLDKGSAKKVGAL
jgi:hypothetical protein